MGLLTIIAVTIVFLFHAVELKLASTRQPVRSGPAPVAKPLLTSHETAMLVMLEQFLLHCRIHA